MVVTETGGAWGRASELTLPTNAVTTAGDQEAYLSSVTCTSPGNCVAAGQYADSADDEESQAMVATETGGVWGQASELKLPANATETAGAQEAFLESVACTGPGSCVVVGDYHDTSGGRQAMYATETGGVWAQASELMLPANVNPAAAHQEASLESVTCTSPGNCVTVGSYNDTSDDQGMVATETGGVWAQASELPLPIGAATGENPQNAFLESVTCTGPGDCVAAGGYEDTNGSNDFQGMLLTETGGVWDQASELALPPGAAATAGAQDASINSVTCTSLGNCVAVGNYYDTNGKDDGQGMLATETGGVWGPASELTLPAGAASAASAQYVFLNSVTCTGPGSCVAVGSYEDSSGDEQAMVLASAPSLSALTPVPPVVVPPVLRVIPQPGSPSIRTVKIKGPKLTITVTCGGASIQKCIGALALTTLQHLTGRKLIAISAARKRSRPKRTTRTVTLAGASYSITGGGSETLTLTLNSRGKQLLAEYHKLPAKLTLTPTGARIAVATKTVKITLDKAKPKHPKPKHL
jgi:hypothetical protein